MFFNLRKKFGNISMGNLVTYGVFICFITGITFGCKGFVIEEEIADEIVKSFQKGADFNLSVTDAFIKNTLFVFFLYLCGMSMIGGICALYLVFMRGVSVGSSVGALLCVAGTQKFLVLLELVPGYFFIISAYILMARSSILYSININSRIIWGKRNFNYKFTVLTLNFAVSVLFCYISALCEAFLIPTLK